MDKLHLDSGFYVKAQRLPGVNSCSVVFPNKILTKPLIDGSTVFYDVQPEGLLIHDENTNHLVECPGYMSRVMMTLDVVLKCSILNVSTLLVQALNADNTEAELGALLDEPRAKLLEDNLKNILYPTLAGQDMSKQAELGGILDGYGVLRRILEKGTL